MWRYFLKRILIFIPIFFTISLISFGLSHLAPGDPVSDLAETRSAQITSFIDLDSRDRIYKSIATELNLDKPLFYFAITTQAHPDTLYRILRKDHRINLKKLIAQHGNWVATSNYYKTIKATERTMLALADSLKQSEAFISARTELLSLYLVYKSQQIQPKLAIIQQAKGVDAQALVTAYETMISQATPQKNWLPKIHWHGLNNQYHQWISRFLVGDFGISLRDYRPVADKIKDGLRWTLLLSISAVVLAYLIAVPLGVWTAVNNGTKLERFITVSLFGLYSLPTFWIATVLLIFFTTPIYGMNWFASIGLGNLPSDAPFWARFWERASHLILPVFCMTYPSLAFIARQMRGSMQEVLQQPYIVTAKAKGLSMKKVIWKHAFRNALFPIITMLGAVIPSLIAGSVIIESVFEINGMGKLLLDAISMRDWTLVYAILMLGAILTMIGILIADLLYAIFDPRIRFR
jgi:peptide/nickel transport system permease protein